MYTKAFIPYRGYYSSPFARWQGSLQNENAIELEPLRLSVGLPTRILTRQ